METVVLKGSVPSMLTDEEFVRFCEDNPDLRIERNSNLEIIIMSPVSTLSSLYSSEIFGQLSAWNRNDAKGLVFDSSVGFTLPDRSVLSPDASWLSKEKWALLPKEERDKFAAVCPEFVIEVRSKTDSLEELKSKMISWIKNGAELAWLIDPRQEICYLYNKTGAIKQVNGFDQKIKGEGPVSGFELDLSLLLRD